MSENLFDMSDVCSGLNEIIVGYFNIMHSDDRFLDATENIIQKESFMLDGVYCFFPDMSSCEKEEHFEGVQFAVGYPPTEDDIVTVNEETCYHYVRLACERYLKFHPEDTDKVNELLENIPT
ncbi:ribonuclease toxin immunity protein CdiI [Pseudomonas sp. Fl5BN2]|uniref:ribonuclease toxin immunity protein CdiI n=1 Tax=Pseudomonas sp. Fl5BN2 TaxID=2697652 RepID=UPI00137878B6|nr:ribonuclease toxin immunity protein CdiI [Pseudomonas sp. Fl5BN2]NBF04887.1 ribonuclease toxin immunity protein CdiI [Pseudomonas sp. Fl5BN2]